MELVHKKRTEFLQEGRGFRIREESITNHGSWEMPRWELKTAAEVKTEDARSG